MVLTKRTKYLIVLTLAFLALLTFFCLGGFNKPLDSRLVSGSDLNESPGSSCYSCSYKYGCVKFYEMHASLYKPDKVCDIRQINHQKRENFEQWVTDIFDPSIPLDKKQQFFSKDAWESFVKNEKLYDFSKIYSDHLKTLEDFRKNTQRYKHYQAAEGFLIIFTDLKKETLGFDIIFSENSSNEYFIEDWYNYPVSTAYKKENMN